MIHTSKQLKDKVRNISKGDNDIAKTLIRNFMMERFLERVSVSDYCNNFILKGGMLVASIFPSLRIIWKHCLRRKYRQFWQGELQIPD